MTEQHQQIDLSLVWTSGPLPKIMTFTYYHYVERALWTFTELDMADLMAEHKSPLTATELSQLNGNNWNADLVYRLLRMMTDLEVVKVLPSTDEKVDIHANPALTRRFQLTENGLFLTRNHPWKVRDVILLELGPIQQKASLFLPDLIRNGYKNGNGFELLTGSSVFDYLEKKENEQFSEVFQNALASFSVLYAPAVVATVDFSRFEKLVDIGGAMGTFLALILQKHANLKGVLFDLDYAINSAKENSPNEFEKRHIDPGRYQLIIGDMFKPETIPQADAYIMKFIIHDWDDEKSMEIFKSIYQANKGSGKKQITVFIVEMIDLSDDIDNWAARASDIEMLLVTSAKERCLPDYINLLNISGYKMKQVYNTGGPYSVIEATISLSESI